MSTSVDTMITANMKKSSHAFHLADGSTDIGPEIIERTFDLIDTGATAYSDADDLDLTSEDDLFTELSDLEIADDPDPVNDDDLQYYADVNNTINARIDIDYIGGKRAAGGSTESQSRYEGIGAGGFAIIDKFRIRGLVQKTQSGNVVAASTVETRYQRLQK